MTALHVIQRLIKAKNRIDKEQVLYDAYLTGEREFFIGTSLCYDPFVIFGVEKVAKIVEDDGSVGSFSFTDFTKLARNLISRELVGDAARNAIHEAAEKCHAETWNEFYRRILLKDLTLGISTNTLNKLFKKLSSADPEANRFIVPSFTCQKTGECVKPIKGKKYVEMKENGSRVITILDKEFGIVSQFSKSGKEIKIDQKLQNGLEKLLTRIPGSVVFDGQLSDKLHLFDIVPLSEFKTGVSSRTLLDRHNIFSSLYETGIIQELFGQSVKIVPKTLIDFDTDEGRTAFEEYKTQAKEWSYDAIMIKEPLSFYGDKKMPWLSVRI